ncbi:penicillin-binding protein activator [Marinimicrobium locisalis]|uniref:penicillin-binding protein activator n=1 Tax=Marinimicrobium locisalis TaxID=546022 RepID=UPI003221F6B7
MHYRGRSSTLLASTLLALTVCLLASCSTTPPEPSTGDDPEALSQEAIEKRVKSLVDQARDSQSPQREGYLLQAAELLVDQNQFDWARNLLTSIDTRQLNEADFLLHTELLGAVSLSEGAYYLAQRILTNPRLEQQWATMSPEREIALREQRARLFELTGSPIASVEERIRLDRMLTEASAADQNREQLWQTMMSLSEDELARRAEETDTRTLRGWLTLASISKDNQANLERQQAQLDQWQSEWPNHPASENLPNDLQLLRKLIAQQPRQIALLLPQQGNLARAADAVRDGFLAAYYEAEGVQSKLPQIRQYDTSGATDIVELYEQAMAEGADLIIGPLDKERVDALHELSILPIPVLTLNYIEAPLDGPKQSTRDQSERRLSPPSLDTSALNLRASEVETDNGESPEGLYQFGLAAEDEARQVARRAIREGHRLAMILAPNRNWSERGARAFTQEWRELGGEVAIDSQFTGAGNYSDIIQQALLIDQSQARRQALTRLLGTRLEFEPRRRQDLDMIFLMADPEQGRQIRPTLAFHYAGDVPVFSTSHIYTGEPDPKSNRDLNGVRFNTLPWLLNGEFPEKQVLNEHTREGAIYSRLHALGVDAYRLYPRLPQLLQIEEARLYGATGALRMRPGGRIERELVWAQFQNGRAQPMASAVTDADQEEQRDDLQPTPEAH